MNLPLIRRILPIGLILILEACGPNITDVALDGTLTILAPPPTQFPERILEEWIITDNIEEAAPRILVENKQLYLAVSGSLSPFVAIRPIKAQLLATPFLSWEWRIIDKLGNYAPFQLTIGFSDDAIEYTRMSIQRLWRPVIPKFARSLTIEWGQSALERGTLKIYKRDQIGRPLARYIARGGRENQNRWWHETIDLSSLYSKAWPNLDMRDTKIVFAGFIVNKVQSDMSGHLRGVRLSR